MSEPVIIFDYDPVWPVNFEEIKAILKPKLRELAIGIEHVGSTSVPGLAAKPILDIDVVISTYDDLPSVVSLLAELGYIHQGNLGIAEREAFARTSSEVPRDGTGRVWPVHHLYVCAQNSRELARHLKFRDSLRSNPDLAHAYGELKRCLAAEFVNDRDGYSRAKTEFVEDVLKSER